MSGQEAPKSHFGFLPEEVPAALELLLSTPHRLFGLHVHHGVYSTSENLYQRLAEQIVSFINTIGAEVSCINLGGGLHTIPMERLGSLVASIRATIPDHIMLLFEPGRFFTLDAGFVLCRILNVRIREATVDVCVDASKDCHFRWSAPRILNMPQHVGPEKRVVRIWGASCFEYDLIGEYELFSRPHENLGFTCGEFMLFEGINGYSAAWNTSFNGVRPAQIAIAKEDNLILWPSMCHCIDDVTKFRPAHFFDRDDR